MHLFAGGVFSIMCQNNFSMITYYTHNNHDWTTPEIHKTKDFKESFNGKVQLDNMYQFSDFNGVVIIQYDRTGQSEDNITGTWSGNQYLESTSSCYYFNHKIK